MWIVQHFSPRLRDKVWAEAWERGYSTCRCQALGTHMLVTRARFCCCLLCHDCNNITGRVYIVELFRAAFSQWLFCVDTLPQLHKTIPTYIMIMSTLRFDDVGVVPGLLSLFGWPIQRSCMWSGRRPGNEAIQLGQPYTTTSLMP